MLNRDVLARDPASFNLADKGVAKVAFPPDPENLPVLREQLEMFVCEGAYADALRRILDAYVAVAGNKTDTPAAWISGFYGSGKSLLAAMLGVQRSTVSQVAGALKADGLIDYTRGEIQILDRPRLERRSCECYATAAHYRALIEARQRTTKTT